MIVIVDYGLGNRGAIVNVLGRLGFDAHTSGDPDEVRRADKLILPGVGAFFAGMRNLEQRGLDEAIRSAIHERGATLLGGMHLLSEGDAPGLGLVRGTCRRFRSANEGGLSKIPHMGWPPIDVAPGKPPFSKHGRTAALLLRALLSYRL